MASRALTLAMGAGLAVASCGLEPIVAPAGVESPRIVVHMVLDAGAGEQRALVRRTRLDARVPGDANDPPELGARLVVYDVATGDSAVAVEGVSPNGAGGAYRIWNTRFPGGQPGQRLSLRSGSEYRLSLRTTLGTITARTRIPLVTGEDIRPRANFDIERDTLRTAAAAIAAGYVVTQTREVNNGTSIALLHETPGVLWVPRRPSDPRTNPGGFLPFEYVGGFHEPGMMHRAAISAADSNFIKYYVAGFDPFGDDTQGNTVRGGVGLFGSLAPLYSQTLDLVAPIDLPIEGRWSASGTSADMPSELVLYDLRFNSMIPTPIFLSGRARFAGTEGLLEGNMLTDSTLSLRIISINAAGPVRVFNATLSGGVLTLRTGPGTAYTYRRP